jgi:phosphoadenosine phosphosulfate reductase
MSIHLPDPAAPGGTGAYAMLSSLHVSNGARALEHATADHVLRWAVQTFPVSRFGLVSAFGPGSSVIIHLLAEIGASLPVVFVDTLHHFPETLAHVERVRARYGLDLRVYRPALDLAGIEARYGPRLWERDLELYQQVTKVEPFRRATVELDGWITGRRRDQSGSRGELPVLQGGERICVNPLARWTRHEVWSYIQLHDLPYNPLHDQGYASIGDAPLTTPVRPGEHERAGRWRGAGRLECGIHLAPHAVARTPAEAAAAEPVAAGG